MRENRADRVRGAMGPTGRGTVAGELSGFLGTESFSGDPTQEIAMPSDDLERLTSQIITCRKCRGSFDTASRSLERNGPRSAIGSIGAGPSPDGATPR